MTELWDSNEVARRLHIKYGTLAKWRCLQSKALPFCKIGNKIFYRPQDVENFVNANVHPGDGPARRRKIAGGQL